jgi:hypothetical protein
MAKATAQARLAPVVAKRLVAKIDGIRARRNNRVFCGILA